ncbi:MAG: helix-turn-helix domain-containing protein [Bacteroidota bacterium]|nr:helix-turn-helix domain-containing protein [Bacteroidota bacterium]
MKFKDKFDIPEEFDDIFNFSSEEDELKHDERMISARFLSEVEKLSNGKIKKKDLAKAFGTSASYITQIFNGDKSLNLYTIAKIQKYFEITFDISAKLNSDHYSVNEFDQLTPSLISDSRHRRGLRIVHLNLTANEDDYKKHFLKRPSGKKINNELAKVS